jgi:hypothetical protein
MAILLSVSCHMSSGSMTAVLLRPPISPPIWEERWLNGSATYCELVVLGSNPAPLSTRQTVSVLRRVATTLLLLVVVVLLLLVWCDNAVVAIMT